MLLGNRYSRTGSLRVVLQRDVQLINEDLILGNTITLPCQEVDERGSENVLPCLANDSHRLLEHVFPALHEQSERFAVPPRLVVEFTGLGSLLPLLIILCHLDILLWWDETGARASLCAIFLCLASSTGAECPAALFLGCDGCLRRVEKGLYILLHLIRGCSKIERFATLACDEQELDGPARVVVFAAPH